VTDWILIAPGVARQIARKESEIILRVYDETNYNTCKTVGKHLHTASSTENAVENAS